MFIIPAWIESILMLFSFAVGLPFIPFFIIAAIYYAATRNTKVAVRRAMDLTTILLIPAVSILFNNIFHTGFGFYAILLFILLAIGLIGNAQYRIKGKLNPNRLFPAVWRLSFVALSVFYFLFVFIGIVIRLQD